MGTFHLPGLGITYNVPNMTFLDIGVVPTIESGRRIAFEQLFEDKEQMESRLADYNSKNTAPFYRTMAGEMLQFISADDRRIALLQIKIDNETDRRTRCHEEGHVLHATNRLDLLADALHGNNIRFRLREYPLHEKATYHEREHIAHIAEYLDMHRRGIDVLKHHEYGYRRAALERIQNGIREGIKRPITKQTTGAVA